ncbi:hypothetical protein [Agrococcus sp. Ld7]|uniref:hypothetical protein n=1 Tax=Agrococcus sp. Ld7 TaxID=649148 RepID=UPI00386BD254
MASPRTPDEPAKRDASQHWSGTAFSAAIWAFAFLMLRIFAVSGYAWETAFLVTSTVGLGDGVAILVGSLMATPVVTEALLIGFLPLLSAAWLWGPRRHRLTLGLCIVLAAVLTIALVLSFGSWWLPLAAAAGMLLIVLMRRLPRENGLRRALASVLARIAAIAAAAMLLLAALVPTPWVPHERIGTAQGTVTGYVLSVDSGYLNVLTDAHEFLIILTADVRTRE